MRQGIIATLIIGVLGLSAWHLWPDPQPMPQARFNLLDGRRIDSAALLGRPVLVNFWSVTCGVCLRDMPKLTRLQETLSDRDLMVIGVAMPNDPPPVVIDLVDKRAPGYAIALDVHGEVNRAFGDVQVTPTTFLIDPAGRIRYAEQGPLDETRIRATLSTFRGEARRVGKRTDLRIDFVQGLRLAPSPTVAGGTAGRHFDVALIDPR